MPQGSEKPQHGYVVSCWDDKHWTVQRNNTFSKINKALSPLSTNHSTTALIILNCWFSAWMILPFPPFASPCTSSRSSWSVSCWWEPPRPRSVSSPSCVRAGGRSAPRTTAWTAPRRSRRWRSWRWSWCVPAHCCTRCRRCRWSWRAIQLKLSGILRTRQFIYKN